MKQRSTTPVAKISFAARACIIAATVLSLAAAPFFATSPVKADKYDDQIAAIQQQIEEYNSQAKQLKSQGDSYKARLARLNNEKSQIQAQLDISTAKANKLAKQIAENEQKISDNKSLLGTTIANMYVDGDISPLEMLASSDNIAEYVDKQSDREQVQENVQSTITKIDELKEKLEKQKKQIDVVVADQTNARSALAKKESETQTLIAQVDGKESKYRSLSKANEKKKLEVQQQQQQAIEAAIAAAAARSGGGGATFMSGDPNKGGYPWAGGCTLDANAVSYGGANGNGSDPLGYGCRQCVSYTAWKVGQKTGDFPRYWGNANMWPASARASGYATGSSPKAGSVGVISAGQYGHVVWVDSVNGDGTINVSQYNYFNAGGSGWGHYSEMRVPAYTYDTYIYF